MPSYTYNCEQCNHVFSIACTIKDYQEKVKCPLCKKKNKVYREYAEDTVATSVRLHLSEITKVGHYAERQTEMKSKDEVDAIRRGFHEYKNNKEKPDLPSGMTWADNNKEKTFKTHTGKRKPNRKKNNE